LLLESMLTRITIKDGATSLTLESLEAGKENNKKKLNQIK